MAILCFVKICGIDSDRANFRLCDLVNSLSGRSYVTIIRWEYCQALRLAGKVSILGWADLL
jgi:hypothetical protein